MTPGPGAPVSGEALLTAEEYLKLPDRGVPTELVRGRVIEMNVPAPRHGEICVNVTLAIGPHIRANGLGHLVSNDGAVRTERGPDTVRGADVSFYSYGRVPKGPIPKGYLSVSPELVFEVRSPTDKWPKVLAKVSEYLDAGVSVVCVLDQMSETAVVFRDDELPRTLEGDDELHLPDVLGDFRVAVRRFFE
jgi:Uma2 family endonuclease